tara:strand:- start:1538 stop:1840 length:303 start_codon:yes stop_codon:yes gene_type:complete
MNKDEEDTLIESLTWNVNATLFLMDYLKVQGKALEEWTQFLTEATFRDSVQLHKYKTSDKWFKRTQGENHKRLLDRTEALASKLRRYFEGKRNSNKDKPF